MKRIAAKIHQPISFLFIAIYLNLIWGCSYFKLNSVNPLNQASISEQAQKMGKYIILHYEERVWHFTNITVDDSSQELYGQLEILPSHHFNYTKAKKEGKPYQFESGGPKIDRAINEIHIYVSNNPQQSNSKIAIPFSSVTKIEFYDRHVGATVAQWVGISAVTVAAMAALVIALKSSCPFVYSFNGSVYTFTGEMYGGAIYPSLERDDYMPLPDINSIDGFYQLKITNELLEKQYTNIANLIVVEHPANSNVIIDKLGHIQTISNPSAPLNATANDTRDFTALVLQKDSIHYLFDHEEKNESTISTLTLSFQKPKTATSGKLILNAKNSFWLDYVYGKFNEQFGIYHNSFAEKQKKESAKKLNQWSFEEAIPLSVYVETTSGWEFVDYFNSVGPLATRDLVMPIDLSKVKGDNVKIKLRCGFMFWEVDYAAMDFTENIPVETTTLFAVSAIDEKGKDVSLLLEKGDDQYLIQPNIGNVVTLKFEIFAPKENSKHTTFLYSKGYYEYIRDYKNWPSITKLQSFKKRGAFTQFAKERYIEITNTQDLLASILTQENGN